MNKLENINNLDSANNYLIITKILVYFSLFILFTAGITLNTYLKGAEYIYVYYVYLLFAFLYIHINISFIKEIINVKFDEEGNYTDVDKFFFAIKTINHEVVAIDRISEYKIKIK